MPAVLNYGGNDDFCPGGPLFSNLMDSSLLLSLAPNIDVYCPPCKRSRVTVPFILRGGNVADEEKHQPRSLDSLPDECLFEILRRLPGDQERSVSACVSKRWLMLLSSIRASEVSALKNPVKEECPKKKPPFDLNGHAALEEEEEEKEEEVNGYLTRRLEGKEATDVRLAAIAVGTCSRGGLGKLYIQGSNSTARVTDIGLSAVARGCPSLQVLSMWRVPFATDIGLSEIANGCPLLEKLDLCQCPLISDKGLMAVAQKCPNLMYLTLESCSGISNDGLQMIGRYCPKLKSVTIKGCQQVADQGLAGLFSSVTSSLERIKLQSLNISDITLAVIGYYGKNVIDLSLADLHNVSEKGFWVMGNTLGLQKLRSFSISSCSGVTDMGLQAIAKGSRSLEHLCVRKSCFISDPGLRAIFETTRALESLQLEECDQVTIFGVLSALLNCSLKFRNLAIVNCLGIKDINVSPTPLPKCMSLRSLTIRGCPGFTGSSLAVVGKICPHLENIDLTGQVGVNDASLLPLIESSGVGLKKVNLNGCFCLTDTVVTALAKAHGSTLQMLSVDDCKKVTDKSLLAIAECCSMLDDLDMSRCNVSDYGVAVLASARQLNLRALSLAGCSEVTQRSLPFLGNMGRSMLGLNLQQCNMIGARGIGLLEEKLWWCDILS